MVPINHKAADWYFSEGDRVLFYDWYGCLREARVEEVSGLALKVRERPTYDSQWIEKWKVSEILPPT